MRANNFLESEFSPKAFLIASVVLLAIAYGEYRLTQSGGIAGIKSQIEFASNRALMQEVRDNNPVVSPLSEEERQKVLQSIGM